MAEELKFHFPLSVLGRDGKLITAAAQATPAVQSRLKAGLLDATLALLGKLDTEDSAQRDSKSASGTMTLQEKTNREKLEKLMSALRKSAGLAFKGYQVKLHDDYQVGVDKPHDTASMVRRAKIMCASAGRESDAAALADQSWLASDTAALKTAIDAFGDIDQTHETAKHDSLDATGQRNHSANTIYDNLQTIQNAASLAFPAENPANAGTRGKFLLGTFPPRDTGGQDKKKPEPPKPA